jgi:hypothetical protein
MRFLQNSSLYPSYVPRLRRLAAGQTSFAGHIGAFLGDGYGAQHFLQPVLERDPAAFFTNGDDELVQRLWAREQGMPAKVRMDDILLAQIEAHRAEVFYNLDPMRYDGSFVKRLPASVKRTIAWRAAPSPGASFAGYDMMVCNFPGILDGYRRDGLRAEYFWPAFDPLMQEPASNDDRPIDVLFVGGYTRHHRRRAALLESVAGMKGVQVALHLDNSRLTRLAESPFGRWLLPERHRRPAVIRQAARPPVFGRDLHQVLARAKIILNGAIDMAGQDRGNLRCFEAMGCRAALLSDAGIYPEGMVDGATLVSYTSIDEALAKIRHLLDEPAWRQSIADAGHRMLRERYSKPRQWTRFLQLAQ